MGDEQPICLAKGEPISMVGSNVFVPSQNKKARGDPSSAMVCCLIARGYRSWPGASDSGCSGAFNEDLQRRCGSLRLLQRERLEAGRATRGDDGREQVPHCVGVAGRATAPPDCNYFRPPIPFCSTKAAWGARRPGRRRHSSASSWSFFFHKRFLTRWNRLHRP